MLSGPPWSAGPDCAVTNHDDGGRVRRSIDVGA
jgi:hypothetical protein